MKAGTRTQVILVQLNFVHERRHHKGESLSVEVVKSVADKHCQKYGCPVVSIACCGHGCRRPLKRSQKSACCSLICDLCFGVCMCRLTGRRRRFNLNLCIDTGTSPSSAAGDRSCFTTSSMKMSCWSLCVFFLRTSVCECPLI